MSFPSGSTLKVILQNGASPNTGPFDIYVNSLTASEGGILIANDVDKATLSGSGYEFITPVETFSVLAHSDSSCITTDIVVLGDIPGASKTIYVTGSYDGSLNTGLTTASVFFDNGYGQQFAGTIPSIYNACPAVNTIGTGKVNQTFNTLITVKTNPTSSEYIKFFPFNNGTSVYYHYIIPSLQSGISLCLDLAGDSYQTVATNSIDVYPSASLSLSSTVGKTNANNTEAWAIVKANGVTIYSSSVVSINDIPLPGNAYIECTSSAILGAGNTGSYSATLNDEQSLYYLPAFNNVTIDSDFAYNLITTSSAKLETSTSFYAVPGGKYLKTNTTLIVGDPATSTLSFNFNGNTVGQSIYEFNLTNEIPSTAITISGADIRAYNDCGGSIVDTDGMSGTVTLTPGLTYVTGSGVAMCYPYYRRGINMVVNGTSVVDGSVVTVGGTQVTISIPNTCEVMPC